jgi:aminopeptidase N
MWFGNLVTMEWWDDIWLNEGFARYFEFHILNIIRPGFKIFEKYFNEVFGMAISVDKNWLYTHPV